MAFLVEPISILDVCIGPGCGDDNCDCTGVDLP